MRFKVGDLARHKQSKQIYLIAMDAPDCSYKLIKIYSCEHAEWRWILKSWLEVINEAR